VAILFALSNCGGISRFARAWPTWPRNFETMRLQKPNSRNSSGQSLVETVLMLPLLLLVVLNVINVAYFFLVAVNLTGAVRSSTLYSIEGSYTPYALIQPAAGSSNCSSSPNNVTCLVFQDLTGAVWNPTGATVRVCSNSNFNSSGQGTTGAGSSQVSLCQTCTSSGCSAPAAGSPAPAADPEAPSFVANQVTINYTFNTIIPGTIFNAALQSIPSCSGSSCTFTRVAVMRSMGP
jgi:Flp pilus assembly protein TadG